MWSSGRLFQYSFLQMSGMAYNSMRTFVDDIMVSINWQLDTLEALLFGLDFFTFIFESLRTPLWLRVSLVILKHVLPF